MTPCGLPPHFAKSDGGRYPRFPCFRVARNAASSVARRFCYNLAVMRMYRAISRRHVRRRFRAGDRLASCGRAASLLVAGGGSYAYDALGRRVSTTTLEGAVRHVYDDSWQCIADIGENGNVLRSYVWGEGIDNLLAVKIGGNVYYPLTDIQGTVWGYADSQNNLVACWMYDAWGNVLSEDVATPVLATLRYCFQGRERSATTGLINFRMRWYDANVGRWLSKDSAGLKGGINLFVLCRNDPVNFFDADGCGFLGLFAKTAKMTWKLISRTHAEKMLKSIRRLR